MSNKKKHTCSQLPKMMLHFGIFSSKRAVCGGVNKNVIFVKENTFDKELEFEWPACYCRRNRRVRIIIHTNICRKSDLLISELSVGGSSSCLGVKFEQNSMMIPCLLADRPAAQVKSAKFSKKCSESLLSNFVFTAYPFLLKKRLST